MYNEKLLSLSKEDYIDYLVIEQGWDREDAEHYADILF